MNGWAAAMLASGGLFSVNVGYFALIRIPVWRSMSWPEFQADFARWLRRADILQPLLVTAAVVSTVGFGLASEGAARTLAFTAAGGFLLILLASGTTMVPLQRRLVAGRVVDVERMRVRWYRGHLVRTAVAVTCLGLAIAAAI